jgi:hypothetical protein
MADLFQPMKVAQILDKTTVVITGDSVPSLSTGDRLWILAVGREIPGVGLPLVVAKAAVEVTSIPGPYLVARTPTYEEETPSNPLYGTLGSLGSQSKTKTITRRQVLTVEEKELIGNPSNTPVTVGDPVIRPADLQSFVASLRK